MKILAIDQASKCGWCIDKNTYGQWDMTTRKDEDMGMKLIRFRNKLREIHAAENIEMIVYERVAGQHSMAIIHAAKLVAMIETFCVENNIRYGSFSAAEIKKAATGKGNAGKPEMIESARIKYGYDGDNDNIADAIHIWNLANSTYN